jgi:hypothetical protein
MDRGIRNRMERTADMITTKQMLEWLKLEGRKAEIHAEYLDAKSKSCSRHEVAGMMSVRSQWLVNRDISQAIADRLRAQQEPEVDRMLEWLDTYGDDPKARAVAQYIRDREGE